MKEESETSMKSLRQTIDSRVNMSVSNQNESELQLKADQSELEHLRVEVSRLTEQLAQKVVELDSSNKQDSELHLRIAQLEEYLKSNQQELEDKESECTLLKEEILTLGDKLDLSAQNSNHEKKMTSDLTTKINELDSELDQIKSDHQVSVQKSDEYVKTLESNLKESKSQLASNEHKYSQKTNEFESKEDQLQSQITSLSSQHSSKDEQIEYLKTQQTNQDAALKALQLTHSHQEQQSSSKVDESVNYTLKLNSLSLERDQYQAKLKEATDQISQLSKNNQSEHLQVEIVALKTRIAELEYENESFVESQANITQNIFNYKEQYDKKVAELQAKLHQTDQLNQDHKQTAAVNIGQSDYESLASKDLIESFKTKVEGLEKEIISYESKIQQMTQEFESERVQSQDSILVTAQADAQANIQEERRKLAADATLAQDRILAIEAREKAVQDELEHIKQQLETANENKLQFDEQSEAVHHQNEEIKGELKAKQIELTKQAANLEVREDDIKGKLKQIRESEAQIEIMQKSVWTDRSFVDQKNELIQSLELKCQELEEKHEYDESRIKVLDERIEREQLENKASLAKQTQMQINILPANQKFTGSVLSELDSMEPFELKQPTPVVVNSFELEDGDQLDTSMNFKDLNNGGLISSSPRGSLEPSLTLQPDAIQKELAKLKSELANQEKIRRMARTTEDNHIRKIDDLEQQLRDKQQVLSKVSSEKSAIENILYTLAIDRKTQLKMLSREMEQLESKSKIELEQVKLDNEERLQKEFLKFEEFLKTKNKELYEKSADKKAVDSQEDIKHSSKADNEEMVAFSGKLLFASNNNESDLVIKQASKIEPQSKKKSSLDDWIESDEDQDEDNNEDEDQNQVMDMQQSILFEKKISKDEFVNTNRSEPLNLFSQTQLAGQKLTLSTGMPKFGDSDAILLTSARSEPTQQTHLKSPDIDKNESWKKTTLNSKSQVTEWRSKARVEDKYVKKTTIPVDKRERVLTDVDDRTEFGFVRKSESLKQVTDQSPSHKSDKESYHKVSSKHTISKDSAQVDSYDAKQSKSNNIKKSTSTKQYSSKEVEYLPKPDNKDIEQVIQKNKSVPIIEAIKIQKGAQKIESPVDSNSPMAKTSQKILEVSQQTENKYTKIEPKSPFMADNFDLVEDQGKEDKDEWTPADKKANKKSDRLSESLSSAAF